MNLNKILDLVEKIVVWSLTGILCFVGLGTLPTNPSSFWDFTESFYYFVTAVILCPKTPLNFYVKLALGFIFFLYGVWIGLI